MSSPSSQSAAIALRLVPSHGLAAVIVSAWLPLVVLAWEIARDTVFAVPLAALVLGLAVSIARRNALLTGTTPFSDLAIKDNQLLSRRRSPGTKGQARTQEWQPGKNSRLFLRLAWLELIARDHPRQRRRLIVTDLPLLANLPPEDFRRLRVWLRLGAGYH